MFTSQTIAAQKIPEVFDNVAENPPPIKGHRVLEERFLYLECLFFSPTNAFFGGGGLTMEGASQGPIANGCRCERFKPEPKKSKRTKQLRGCKV